MEELKLLFINFSETALLKLVLHVFVLNSVEGRLLACKCIL